ncbi:hypothetical protein [Lactobacillus sp. 3B(2020)]|nr:hypothetical protein [Lactobacillus sp. 3B(2020)]QLL69779.1 hypothetical protein GTO83_04105 [Lactobacillus sp. 3B(2020)]
MIKVKTFWDEVNKYVAEVVNHGGKVVDINFSADDAGAYYSIIAEVQKDE